MKNRTLFVACLLLLCLFGAVFLYWFRVEVDSRNPQRANGASFSHDLFNQVLQEHVDEEGRVDYAKLKAKPEKLEAYLDLLAVVNPAALSYNAQLAFWLNAYNALVIKGVIAYYPTTSVRKIKPFGGFFYRLKFHVAGKTYTLNQIEHDIIRAEFVDARVHFVLVCASLGCPAIENRAFSEETLEERLETATINFVRNPNKVRLDRGERQVYLSKIFKWYADDFTEGYEGIADFLSDYLPSEDAEFLAAEEVKFRYLDYDWTLNDK